MKLMAALSQGCDKQAPVIVGGIGGSGTRVVAEILQASGVYLGTYLNAALDNVFFARLITKDPEWWTRDDLDRRL
ncbi:MAG: hypothetical protein R3330_13010, partial [Saprospiraceae bacterium]|nr:hypothetical protein [Saprospiraceae bacterium]